MSKHDAVSRLLAAREFGYTWFRLMLGCEPTPALLEWALSRGSLSILEELLGPARAGFGAIEDTRRSSADVAADELAKSLRGVYVGTFVGPGKLPLSHWESTYRSGNDSLFQPLTLEVRRAYAAEGYLPAGYPHVADDHVAIELDFVAKLAGEMSIAWEAENFPEVDRLAASSTGFLDEHLLFWAPRYAAAAEGLPAECGFYRGAILALDEFLRVDRRALEEVRREIGGR